MARSRISAGVRPGQGWRINDRATRITRARTGNGGPVGAATDHPRHRPGPTSGPAGAHCHGSSPPPDRAQPRPGRRRHRSTPPLAWARLRPRCSHLTAPQAARSRTFAGPHPGQVRCTNGRPTRSARARTGDGDGTRAASGRAGQVFDLGSGDHRVRSRPGPHTHDPAHVHPTPGPVMLPRASRTLQALGYKIHQQFETQNSKGFGPAPRRFPVFSPVSYLSC